MGQARRRPMFLDATGEPDSLQVLHVEDDPVFRRLAGRMLEDDAGLDVAAAATAEEALERIPRGDFDCVVSDHEMPGRTGLELLEAVREDRPDLPFILLTGRGSEEVASRAVSAGVTDYVQKQKGADQFEVLAQRIRQAVDKRRNREAAQRVHGWYEALLEHTEDVVSVVGEDGTFLYESPAVEDVLGYGPEERVGSPVLEYVHPDDQEAVEAASEAPGATRVECRARTADGTWRWIETVATEEAVEGIGGKVAVTRDISERKERERDLEVAETLFRHSRDVVFLIEREDDGYRVHRINPAAEEETGIPADLVEGKTLEEAFGPDLVEQMEGRYLDRCLDEGGPLTVKCTIDHDELPSRWEATLVPVAEDDADQVVGVARTVDENRERRLVRRAEALLRGTREPSFVAGVDGKGLPVRRVSEALAEMLPGDDGS